MNSNEMVTDYGLDALAAILHETAIEKGYMPKDSMIKNLNNRISQILM